MLTDPMYAARPQSVNLPIGEKSSFMILRRLMFAFMVVGCALGVGMCRATDSCAGLDHLKLDGVDITKASPIPAGQTVPPAYPGAPLTGPLPAHCRVDGVINRRRG